MAIWQFDFYLLPASSVEQRFRAVPVTVSADEYDRVRWWEGINLRRAIEHDLSKMLSQGNSWSPAIDMWGTEDGDRVELHDDDGVTEVHGRIDIRNLSLRFVNLLVEIARRHRLLILTEDRHVLRPSVKEVLAAIHRSRSFAYVSDPEGFLCKLAESE